MTEIQVTLGRRSTSPATIASFPSRSKGLDVRGRAVRLGPLLDAILARHDYPAAGRPPARRSVVLTVLLGTSLKFEGKFIVQTQSDGPVDLLVVDFSTPEDMRGYARFDAQAVLDGAVAAGETEPAQLLGKGVLAFTIDQGEHHAAATRASSRSTATRWRRSAGAYFRQSEQIPTACHVWPSAELFDRDRGGKPRHRWRAGGMVVQFLPEAPERMRQPRPARRRRRYTARRHSRKTTPGLKRRSLVARSTPTN